MGMIIRVAFNNQQWAGKCVNADKRDRRLYKCWEKTVKTGYKVNKKGRCLADCLESILCKKYLWINFLGNFDKERAKGKVYFTYPDIDNTLVLWGKSKIRKVEEEKVFFEKFKPMPEGKWVRGLTAKTILGQHWKSNTFRYIDQKIEKKLEKILKTSEDSFQDPIETVITEKEGKEILRKHLTKERSNRLVAAFKNSLSSFKCSICGFDFEKFYGDIGKEFIEAHHVKPVHTLKRNTTISTNDLIAVCSNCHRMIHRKKEILTPEELKKKIKSKE